MGAPLDTLISTHRLTLAPARRQDYADWARLRADSRAYIEPWEPSWPSDALSRRDWNRRLAAWTAAWKSGTAHIFLIRRQSDHALLGGLSFTQVRPWPADTASLGYWQGGAFEGQGYMREAVSAACEWAFRDLGLWRIEAGIVPENVRSRRVLEGTGFAEEGQAAAYLEIAGTRRDHVLFGLVRPRPDR
ncbi:MAG: GNAT family protein [Hyphomonas sp.]|uniref:GNAT family N-acetyltransferase n=1 Tax=Hyphomonas sp. TaxID=87 RepID=UPI0034A019CE